MSGGFIDGISMSISRRRNVNGSRNRTSFCQAKTCLFPERRDELKDSHRDDEMSGQTEQQHYVYTLAYPDGRVFYVGERFW